MPTQEQQLIIQQAQDKISVLKNCVLEVENQLHETTLGLQDMKQKIHHQQETFELNLKQAQLLDKDCREALIDIDNEDLKVLDQSYDLSSQEHFIQKIIQIYLGRIILYRDTLLQELLELNKSIQETQLHQIQTYCEKLNRYLLDDNIFKQLALWCEVSCRQSKIIQLACQLQADLKESEHQYDLLIQKVDERKHQLEEVQEGLEGIGKSRRKVAKQ